MTRKITPAIMIGLALIAIAPNARAEIASKEYVDEQNALILGDEVEDFLDDKQGGTVSDRFADVNTDIRDLKDDVANINDDIEDLEGDIGNVETSVDNVKNKLRHAVKIDEQYGDGILITTSNGNVKVSEKVNLGHLLLPSPSSACTTRGCMLLYYNGKYVWEPVTRDNNETISTTGYTTDGALVDEEVYTHTVAPASCQNWSTSGGGYCLDSNDDDEDDGK